VIFGDVGVVLVASVLCGGKILRRL